MDWKSLGKKVVQLGAPLLGGALGGPAGASLGTLVSSAFGGDPEDPEDLLNQMTMDSEAAIKLKEIEAKNKERLEEIALQHHQAELVAETQRIQSVNVTMQAEAKAEKWPQYSWRPTWGFVSAAAFLAVCIFICILAWRAVTKADQNAMQMIPQMIIQFTALFAIPGAILGVSAWHRGKQKRESINKISQINS